MKNSKFKVKDIALIALFVALIIVGAFIKIPTPFAPITLQSAFVLLAALVLGAKRSTIAVATYIVMGLLGVPVFATGGGLGYVFAPTFGYLIGFLVCAIVVGNMADSVAERSRGKTVGYIAAALVGTVIVYLFGGVYVYLIVNFYVHKQLAANAVILNYTLPFIPGDILKALVAAGMADRLRNAVNLG